ncbi:hypothetical protein [Lacipirellula sp.]
MPDATIEAEAESIYFCVYGGRGNEFFGRAISKLVSLFGGVSISDRE